MPPDGASWMPLPLLLGPVGRQDRNEDLRLPADDDGTRGDGVDGDSSPEAQRIHAGRVVDDVPAFALVVQVQVVVRTAVESVVPDAARQHVVAGSAAQDIGAGVADQHIRIAVAGRVDSRGTHQNQVLGVGGQHVGDRGNDRVDARVERFDTVVSSITYVLPANART